MRLCNISILQTCSLILHTLLSYNILFVINNNTLSHFICLPVPDKSKIIYPEVSFQGKIVYSKTAFEVDRASKELLKFVQAKKREGGHIVLGFDIEWKPTFKRGLLKNKTSYDNCI